MTSFKEVTDAAQAQMIHLSKGPSKFDLMLALFDRKSVNTRKVEFQTGANKSYTASISMVRAEDGSGDSWIIEGHAAESVISQKRFPIPNPGFEFSGYFNTATRKGHITPLD
jgi:hypothetical protein